MKDGRTEWFTAADGYTNAAKSVWSLAFDTEDRLWIADWSNLRSFHDGRFETAIGPEIRQPLRTVYTDHAGTVWAGMSGHAWRHGADGNWAALMEDPPFGRAEVAAFCQTRSGELWVGTRKGLYYQQDGEWKAFTGNAGLRNQEVRVLFEDRENNLWVGTGTAGLARLKRRVLQTFTAQNGISDGAVLALREHPEKELWIGLQDGQLLHGKPGHFAKFQGAEGFPGDAPVKSLLFGRDDALWVGTFGNGLMRFHEGHALQFAPSVGSPARIDKILALMEDREGAVWVGTFYSLYKQSRSTTNANILEPVPVNGRLLRAPVTALLESSAGGVWAAFEGMGVVRLFENKSTWLSRREGLPSHFIRALHEDKAGTLWIGTAGGLCSWREGKLFAFTQENGLVNETISQILEDDAGNLWLGSYGGIMRVGRGDLQAVAEGRKRSLQLSAFGRGEGMLSEECLGGFSPAGLRSKDGKLWFPTAKGLVMADPAHLKHRMDSPPPPVYVEEIRVDGKVVAHPHTTPHATDARPASNLPIVLAAGTSRVEFNYTALSFAAPDRVRFRHRLEGYDPDWTEAEGARSAVYNKLPAGRYTFQVSACNHNGAWNEAGYMLAFRVAAPFWQTWWGWTVEALVASGLIAGVARGVSVRQLRRKLRRLEEAHAIEKERMRIAQDMHDEIGGKLSRISFLSDLARRELPEKSETGQQIDEVSEAAREVIRTVDEIVWAVSPRNDTLESLTHYICRHAEDFFEFTPVELELELPAEFPSHRLSADIRHNLFCSVKEALNNVLKHAEASKVHITFIVKPGVFQVKISDNGRGFQIEELASITLQPSIRQGNGLLNMRERIESVRGEFTLRSEPGQGVQALFSVPLK
jgi:signal transduction histidine kinase/ligand-binding sensor domain-containing protein